MLIINAVQLTAQIWLNNKLWPEGYNFFSYAASVPGVDKVLSLFNRNAASGSISDNVALPDKIVINGGGARTVNYSGSDAFKDALKVIAPYIDGVFSQGAESETINDEQWQTMLRGKSVFIDFGFPADAKNIAGFFGSGSNGSSVSFENAESMILYPETVLNSTSVCFKTGSSFIKYSVSGNADGISKFIENETIGRKHEDAFAFELHLDRDSANPDIKKKVVLKPYVLLSTDAGEINKLFVSGIFENSDDVSKKADKILRAFGYTASQLRKTVAGDGTVSYLENSATIKIHPDGLVEYKAVATERGIKLAEAKAAPSQIVSAVLDIAGDIVSYAELDDIMNLRLRSPLNETPVSSYTAEFERYYNGMPVISKNSETGGSALYAQFENGYITELKMQLQRLKLSEETSSAVTVLSAIDKFCETLDPNVTELPIENIYRCYYTDGEGEYEAKWCINHSGAITVP